MGLSRDFQVSNVGVKSQMQMVEQRQILRMLEKSLARELDLEKKLTKSKENEEDLKLKLRLTEQVTFCMEEAAEVVWGRFLESDNAAEVLLGISKGLVGRLQVVQFNLNGSAQREEQMKSRLQECIEQLKAKETIVQKLNSSNAQLIADNSEVSALKEKVTLLEAQLRESESQLKKANGVIEVTQDQLREMDSVIESLKENIYATESRAESAEAKIVQLTETNLELTEELGFLKGNNDSSTEKVSLLEKQLRELEPQLQHARASSEASQEQQNLLYSAIWDMETLIDELKQKVSKAESKCENAEEQCLILSETNLDLNKELDFLRSRMECLETSLNQVKNDKLSRVNDITVKTNLIMDMIMQLATERERIQKQLYSLREENKILRVKLQRTMKDASVRIHDNGGNFDRPSSKLGSANPIRTEICREVATEPSSEMFQAGAVTVEELSKDTPASETEVGSSITADSSTNSVLDQQAEGVDEAAQPWQLYTFMALAVLLLSMLATYLLNKTHSP
ncbi:unnamed protein product [Ilex paraguariensis]|uniref:Uncharacterized protein n=1 Tax=Ilex paraguariensis TaxID=185542 RepID=A0ABC8SJ81_9AQUA